MPDVEMKPAEDKSKASDKDKEPEKEKEPAPVPPTPVQEIKANIALIERAVTTLEPRFTHRVLRSLSSLRKKLDDQILRDAIQEVYPKGARNRLASLRDLTFRKIRRRRAHYYHGYRMHQLQRQQWT